MILSASGGVPSAMLFDGGLRVCLGFDTSVSIIVPGTRGVVRIDPELGRLSDIIDTDGIGIIAVFELGLVRLAPSGEIVWKFDAGDILTGWDIVRENIQLNLMETESPLVLDLATGYEAPVQNQNSGMDATA